MKTGYDPYVVLGVDRSAPDEDIAVAYRRLILRWHPDRNQGSPEAEERTKAINAAYAELRTPEARAAIDERLRRELAAAAWAQHSSRQKPTRRRAAPKNLSDLAELFARDMRPHDALRLQLAACIGDLFIEILRAG